MIVRDEADRIDACLSSVSGWADEVVVLDSGSTDGTVDIVRRHTDKVWVTDWPGYGAQRNRALEHCNGDWVFSLDADEVVSPALRDEIDHALDGVGAAVNVVCVPWRTFLLGRPLLRGRYAAQQIKLFRRDGVQYRDRTVHETPLVPNRKEFYLRNRLDHYSWRSYRHAQEKHLAYATLLAQQKYAAGQRSTLLYAAFRFVSDFIHQYVVRGGFLDGSQGFLMAVVLGQYAFHKYATLWSLGTDHARVEGSNGR
jgi:glycosyltransferase involved in cell wall biosynthesis